MENEIRYTRTGGLGSSDAKTVAKIAKNGCLNEADRQRIAIMLGLEEQKQFSTVQTEYGKLIEDKIYQAIITKFPNAVSNPYYKSEQLSKKYGFNIFNHIDYEIEEDKRLIWIENKATKKEIMETVQTYYAQLAWHYMLLTEKAQIMGKQPALYISHYLVTDYIDFVPENLSFLLFDKKEDIFTKGFEIISREIKDFHYEKMEEYYADNLPEETQNKLIQIKNFFSQIAEADKQIDRFKETMLAQMIANNVKSVKNEFFLITMVPDGITTTFDKKKFEREHPKLAKKYNRQSQRKAYLTIKNY